MLRLLRRRIGDLLESCGSEFAEVGEEDDEEDFHAVVVSAIYPPLKSCAPAQVRGTYRSFVIINSP